MEGARQAQLCRMTHTTQAAPAPSRRGGALSRARQAGAGIAAALGPAPDGGTAAPGGECLVTILWLAERRTGGSGMAASHVVNPDAILSLAGGGASFECQRR